MRDSSPDIPFIFQVNICRDQDDATLFRGQAELCSQTTSNSTRTSQIIFIPFEYLGHGQSYEPILYLTEGGKSSLSVHASACSK